ncbi:MAG TPA: hypothetical protein PLD59_06425 [Tepidisphaeraceae bacterium]|nr:hypothetical protein [Tepidisphaeraceae bacterium]
MLLDSQLLESLSPGAGEALQLNAAKAYRALVVTQPGSAEARARLDDLTPSTVLARPVVSPRDAAAALAGLWLWHDHLDESHRLSQAIDTPAGSYWHAIMHRREGDFWNSKYWLNKCRGHPALGLISRQATDMINAAPSDQSIIRLTLGDFDAAGFVDVVEAVHNHPDDPRRELIVALQKIEWRALFEHCLRAATG